MYDKKVMEFTSFKSSKAAAVIGLIVILVLVLVILAVWVMGNRARSALLRQQSLQNQAPVVAAKQQVKKIILKRTTAAGEETVEIVNDGRITRYDKNGKVIKSGQQGFGTIRGLFERIEYLLETGQPIHVGDGYELIIETNKGTIVIPPSPNPSPGTGGDIIDDIIDIIDRTLDPTPRPATPAPSASPATPDYLSAPPFNCDDYYQSGKPVKISNIYCGLNE